MTTGALCFIIVSICWVIIIAAVWYQKNIINKEDKDMKKRKADKEKIDRDNMFLIDDIRHFEKN